MDNLNARSNNSPWWCSREFLDKLDPYSRGEKIASKEVGLVIFTAQLSNSFGLQHSRTFLIKPNWNSNKIKKNPTKKHRHGNKALKSAAAGGNTSPPVLYLSSLLFSSLICLFIIYIFIYLKLFCFAFHISYFCAKSQIS